MRFLMAGATQHHEICGCISKRMQRDAFRMEQFARTNMMHNHARRFGMKHKQTGLAGIVVSLFDRTLQATPGCREIKIIRHDKGIPFAQTLLAMEQSPTDTRAKLSPGFFFPFFMDFSTLRTGQSHSGNARGDITRGLSSLGYAKACSRTKYMVFIAGLKQRVAGWTPAFWILNHATCL